MMLYLNKEGGINMPNYDRSRGEKYVKAQNAGILTGVVALGVGIVAKVAKTVAGHSNDIIKLELKNQILTLNREIDELKNDGILAKFRNRKEISAKKKKRDELQKEYNKL